MAISTKTITTHFGIDYGKPFKTSPKAGWYVYTEATGQATRLHTVYETEAEAIAAAHAEQKDIDDRKAARAAEKAAEPVEEKVDADLATPRQVDYIMSLIHQGRHQEGGHYTGPTTREGVARMTKAAASVYINSLTNRF